MSELTKHKINLLWHTIVSFYMWLYDKHATGVDNKQKAVTSHVKMFLWLLVVLNLWYCYFTRQLLKDVILSDIVKTNIHEFASKVKPGLEPCWLPHTNRNLGFNLCVLQNVLIVRILKKVLFRALYHLF